MPKRPPLEARWVLSSIGLVVFLSMVQPLQATEGLTLRLRNGDRLTGEWVSEDASQITIRSQVYGSVTVPLAQVVSRESVTVEGVAEASSSGSQSKAPDVVTIVPAAKPVAAEGGAVPLAQAPPPAKATDGAKPAAAVPAAAPKPKGPKRWSFDIQVGSSLQYNQVENQLFHGSARVNYKGLKYRDYLEYTANYGETDETLTVNNMNGKWRVERDFSKRMFVFNDAGAGYDEIRRIDFTYDDSFGVGYKLITATNFTLTTDTGLNYQAQYFANDESREVFAVRLGERVTWKISDKLELTESFEVYLRSASLQDYRFRFEATLRYMLNSSINLNLSVIDQYDSEPAPGVTPNDLQFRSTLGVRF